MSRAIFPGLNRTVFARSCQFARRDAKAALYNPKKFGQVAEQQSNAHCSNSSRGYLERRDVGGYRKGRRRGPDYRNHHYSNTNHYDCARATQLARSQQSAHDV
jgi:hypothetical protein